jgi:NAD(P)-dependent dehydrogenase (short-subunit alcohol dehydrogenase family)
LEAREHGIRVNALSPGYLRTKMIADFVRKADGVLV